MSRVLIVHTWVVRRPADFGERRTEADGARTMATERKSTAQKSTSSNQGAGIANHDFSAVIITTRQRSYSMSSNREQKTPAGEGGGQGEEWIGMRNHSFWLRT